MNNFAARQAKGSIFVLLNNDIEVFDAGWLREMVSNAVRDDVGAVGAKLLHPSGTIQHAGVVISLGGAAGHYLINKPGDTTGYSGNACITRQVSAVTGACLAVGKNKFWEVGGLDEVNLPIAFNDIDLCLKLQKVGYRNIWTPYAELYHHESLFEDTKILLKNKTDFKRKLPIVKVFGRTGSKMIHTTIQT